MKLSLLNFQDNIFNEKYSAHENQSEDAFILFHGFPGSGGRNSDLAEHISEKLKIDVFLSHYEGLGLSQGLFSFRKSIEQSYSYFKHIQSMGYRYIFLLGHSWGGFVVLNLLADLKPTNVKSVYLLSPFNYIPDNQLLEQYIELIYSETHEDFKQPIETMKSQIYDIKNNFQIRLKIDELLNSKSQITIFQALDDVEVSPESTKDFYELIKNNKKLIMIDTDHSFSKNKPVFIKQLTNEII